MDAPIVLLNAFPLDRGQWEPLLSALGEDIRGDVITFDMPGIGDMPLSPEDPSLDLIADAAVTAMREATGAHAAVWIGCSMGGYVAMSVAQSHADAVAGLGLIATKASADTAQAAEQRRQMAAHVDHAPSHPDPRGAAEGLVGTVGPGREPLLDLVAANVAHQGGAGIAWNQRAMAARPDRLEVLRGVDALAVVIAGELDSITPRAEMDRIAEALDTDLVVIAGVGHLAALEAPAEVAASLRPLLTATSAATQ